MCAESQEAMNINVKAVLRERLGGAFRWVPGFLTARLEKLICQDQLNELLRHNHPKTGADFCQGVLSDLNVRLEAVNAQLLPPAENRRVMIVSNHPLGGLDGMALIAYFRQYYGCEVNFIVNDLLMAVKPLNNVFIPINKHGRQSREALVRIDRAMEADAPVVVFPAGLVSRQRRAGGEIADLEWKKMFVNRAIAHRRDVVPMFFDGANSPRFYSMARRREALGMKFNIEMILLPGEVFKSRNKTFKITFGKTIAWQSLRGGAEAADEAQAIRRMVYALKKEL